MPSKSSAWMPRVTNRQSIPKPWAPARSVRTESPIASTRASGDSVRTDIAGARSFGIDCLFVTRGIHAEDFEGVDQLDIREDSRNVGVEHLRLDEDELPFLVHVHVAEKVRDDIK